MLQSLLADRFKLVVRKEGRALPAFNLTVGKGKPKLKESDGTGETGCKSRIDVPPGAGGPDAAPVNISSCLHLQEHDPGGIHCDDAQHRGHAWKLQMLAGVARPGRG
jgi:uncharacterized protein (TIGR03435 family)